MTNFRHTALSLGVALTVALAMQASGANTGLALILGAVVGIAVSLVLQRRAARSTSGPLGGSDEPEDIDAALASAQATLRDIPPQLAQIDDESTREIASRTGEYLASIVQHFDASSKRGTAPLIVDQLIEPAQALLTDYLWLQKRPESTARDAMTKITLTDLPAAEHSARQVLALLERPGPVDVAALRRAVDFQFSFGGETVVLNQDMWGNREQLVRAAERDQ